MTKIFIDGSSGTTGLRIRERLALRKDVEIISLPEELRKEDAARTDAINRADVVFLCLPDDAAVKACEMATSENTVIIDTSTAHRVAPGWTYGFPELRGQREKIARSKRIANPGCHASGFIALIAPLTDTGILEKSEKLTCFSLTGYSGGGKKMIADYENGEKMRALQAPRVYGLNMSHKHLPEMTKICGLDTPPLFSPIVSSFFSGMEVSVPLFGSQIKGGLDAVKEVYRGYYGSGLVRYVENADENGFMSSEALSGRDDMEISVFGTGERMLLTARFDNLGKGASGAAIQNMNIVLGLDEKTGLDIEG